MQVKHGMHAHATVTGGDTFQTNEHMHTALMGTSHLYLCRYHSQLYSGGEVAKVSMSVWL